jgi:AraC-like DNA-binding protein
MLTLNQVLDGLTIEAQPFAICEARGDNVIDLGAREHATLHYVLSGTGTFALSGYSDFVSDDGTILIAPANTHHRLRAQRNSKCEALKCAPLAGDWQLHQSGSGDAGVIVACSEITLGYRDVEGLFDYLQAPLVCDVAENGALKIALDQVIGELAEPQIGSHSLVRALMQQCMIHILRHASATAPDAIQWLTAVHDERLWRAVRAIFDHPEAPHTLDDLAETAQMSRTSFAEHFKQAFDRGPIDLLKEVRLRWAARLLVTTDLSTKAISRQIGYDSRSYFSRAFHEQFGSSPADFRDHLRRAKI